MVSIIRFTTQGFSVLAVFLAWLLETPTKKRLLGMTTLGAPNASGYAILRTLSVKAFSLARVDRSGTMKTSYRY
jgi:hypothetical protein